MDTSCMINVDKVSVSFKKTEILHQITMRVRKQSVCGLVGRNGSGKTVLMKCICGFLPVTEGEITVAGLRIGKDVEFSPHTGFIIEHPGFLPQYSGIQNLRILSSLKSSRSDEQLKEYMRKVGLEPEDCKRVGKYSMGMKQRLGIAQALMDNPDLLILDEPFNGLDQRGVEQMRKLLLEQKEEGKTILLASHNMEDIRTLCDEVYQMDGGRAVLL